MFIPSSATMALASVAFHSCYLVPEVWGLIFDVTLERGDPLLVWFASFRKVTFLCKEAHAALVTWTAGKWAAQEKHWLRDRGSEKHPIVLDDAPLATVAQTVAELRPWPRELLAFYAWHGYALGHGWGNRGCEPDHPCRPVWEAWDGRLLFDQRTSLRPSREITGLDLATIRECGHMADPATVASWCKWALPAPAEHAPAFCMWRYVCLSGVNGNIMGRLGAGPRWTWYWGLRDALGISIEAAKAWNVWPAMVAHHLGRPTTTYLRTEWLDWLATQGPPSAQHRGENVLAWAKRQFCEDCTTIKEDLPLLRDVL